MYVISPMPSRRSSVLSRSLLSLVDLAGSEKWRPSLSVAGGANADQYEHDQKQLGVQKEMANINNSLVVLGTCVSALLEPGRKHIPYRNSALTRLLQDSIGGSGRTILIATVRRDEVFLDETHSTLSFAARASNVKTQVVPSVTVSDVGTLDQARQQISALRSRLQQYQSQENGEATLSRSSSFNSDTRVSYLEKKLQQLENENATLRKLVDPLLLSKVRSLVEDGSNDRCKLQLQSSFEGNAYLRRSKSEKLQPSPGARKKVVKVSKHP